MNTNNLDVWLNKLIYYYREKVLELSLEERRYSVYNFGSPCQVNVLWSANDQSESNYQLLLFTHFLKKPDLQFNIFGPFEPYRFSEYAAKMLVDPQWSQELPDQDDDMFGEISERNYRDLLTRILQGFFRSHERYFTQRALLSKDFPSGLIASKQGLLYENNDFLWEVWGDVRVLDPEELIAEDLKDAEASLNRIRNVKSSEKTNKAEPSRKSPEYGALLFPPIWIGEKPTQSMEDQIQGKPIQARVIWNGDYGDSKIILRQDGFVVIMLPESIVEGERKTTALEKLNELIAGMFLSGIPIEAIREHDLVEVTVDRVNIRLGSMSWSPENMRRPFDSANLWGWVELDSFPLTPSRTNISEEKLATALRFTTDFSGSLAKRNLASFVLESYTLLRNAEYSQSFLSSWLAIETHIGILWNTYIESRKVAKKRVKRLEDPNRWSVGYLLETLDLAGRLRKGEYDDFMELKSKRNKVTHSGARITENEARECLELATEIVKKIFQGSSTFLDNLKVGR